MESILIASNADKGLPFISELLRSKSFTRISTTTNAGEARRYLLQNDFDLVIIDTPLTDEFGDDLAIKAAESTTAGVLLVAGTQIADEVAANVEDFGIFVIGKPVSPEFFYQATKLLNVSRKRILGLQKENVKLQQKIQEIRVVDRAKCALIQYLNMTEQQAHRHIEKQAMDMRLPRLDVAENILKTYEQ